MLQEQEKLSLAEDEIKADNSQKSDLFSNPEEHVEENKTTASSEHKNGIGSFSDGNSGFTPEQIRLGTIT